MLASYDITEQNRYILVNMSENELRMLSVGQDFVLD